LITTLCLDFYCAGANAPLKLGQYIHKNIVPIIENKSLYLVGLVFSSNLSITSFGGDVT